MEFLDSRTALPKELSQRAQESVYLGVLDRVGKVAIYLDAIDRLHALRAKDARLGKRIRSPLEQFSSSPGGAIPLACQDWANTKGVSRNVSRR